MKNIIQDLKKLSISGVLAIYTSNKKIRLISSSNILSGLQRILPELKDGVRVKILQENIPDKKLRSLICYIHKVRLQRLGYTVESRIKRWSLVKGLEEIEGRFRWVVRLKNTYNDMVIGVFADPIEMKEFLKKYYPGERPIAAIISSNDLTRRYYEVHTEI